MPAHGLSGRLVGRGVCGKLGVGHFLSCFRLRIAVRFPLRERILRKRLAAAVARCGLLSWERSRVVPFLA